MNLDKKYTIEDLFVFFENQNNLRKAIKLVLDIDNNKYYKFKNNKSKIITEKNFEKIKELKNQIDLNNDYTYLVGYRYFRRLKINLSKDVFVPQWDTEQLIDIANRKEFETFFEIGTGSGILSLSLLKENVGTKGIAIDISNGAIELTRKNILENKIDSERLTLINEDFFKFKLKNKVNLLISNPPYVDKNNDFIEDWVLVNQPDNALYSKKEPLFFYEYIFKNYKNFVQPKGRIVLEINPNSYHDIKNMVSKSFSKYNFYKCYSMNKYLFLEIEVQDYE